MAAAAISAAILDNFEWPYLRNSSRSTYIARDARGHLCYSTAFLLKLSLACYRFAAVLPDDEGAPTVHPSWNCGPHTILAAITQMPEPTLLPDAVSHGRSEGGRYPHFQSLSPAMRTSNSASRCVEWRSQAALAKSYLHVVENFEERERHSTANNHLVHLVQHTLDQLDLVGHFCSAKQRLGQTSGYTAPAYSLLMYENYIKTHTFEHEI